MALYRGFSFKNWQRTKSFVLTDIAIVKQDLLNHIYTRTGERVGMRSFGTALQDLLFEPFDNNLIVAISNQVRGVISYDPRVKLLSDDDYQVITDLDNRRIAILANLYYVELNLKNVLHINLTFEG
jgi:phage baseplate assembly protein W